MDKTSNRNSKKNPDPIHLCSDPNPSRKKIQTNLYQSEKIMFEKIKKYPSFHKKIKMFSLHNRIR
jgi:hypothetical protein